MHICNSDNKSKLTWYCSSPVVCSNNGSSPKVCKFRNQSFIVISIMTDCGVISFWSTLYFRDFSKFISCQRPVLDLYDFYRMEGQRATSKACFPVLFLMFIFSSNFCFLVVSMKFLWQLDKKGSFPRANEWKESMTVVCLKRQNKRNRTEVLPSQALTTSHLGKHSFSGGKSHLSS